jgi:hypothetical protein
MNVGTEMSHASPTTRPIDSALHAFAKAVSVVMGRWVDPFHFPHMQDDTGLSVEPYGHLGSALSRPTPVNHPLRTTYERAGTWQFNRFLPSTIIRRGRSSVLWSSC